MSAKQVVEFMKDNVEVFMILDSVEYKSKAIIGELHVVCNIL